MANPQEITVTFFSDSPRPITRHTLDNLPPHIKGVTKWNNTGIFGPGYYVPQEFTPTNAQEPIEFLNNSWYALIVQGNKILCKSSEAIPQENTIGLGYWKITDPQHPNYHEPIKVDVPSRSASRNMFRAPTSESSSSLGTSTISAHTAQSVETTHKPNSPAVTQPPPTIASVTALFGPLDPPNDPPVDPDTEMSVNATTTTPNPPNNGMKGTAPAIFTGDHSRSDTFWNEFRRYCLLNRNNKSVKVPFFRVLTTLSYIQGPLVEDWVNARDEELERCVDPTRRTSVGEDDKILWDEFEAHFKSAWKDTAKTQNAYDKLM
jgi:hypothetical protein